MQGRPSGYNEELADRICHEIATGSNLYKLADLPGFPTYQTIFNWFKSHPDFFERYARARELRADRRSDRIDQYVEEARAGTLDPNTARVIIDAEKWQAAHESPKRYGDLTKLEHSGPGGKQLQINVTRVDQKPEK